MVKVSVIVPVYNTENYIDKCLSSLENQDLEEIEVIIINDGSTDNSKNKIMPYIKNNPNKFKYYEKENSGLGATRNYGITKAQGEYIGFVDSDDYIEKTMFKKMYDIAKNQNLDFLECGIVYEYKDKRKNVNENFKKNKRDLYINAQAMVCNKIFKLDIIREHNVKFAENLRYEDLQFFYTFIPYINRFSYTNDIFYHYIQRENSIINSQNDKNSDIFKVLSNVIKEYKDREEYEKWKIELEYLYIRILLGSSFLRIIKINEKSVRKDLIEKTIYELEKQYPKWKKNEILIDIKGKKNVYFKIINKKNIKLFAFLFRLIGR